MPRPDTADARGGGGRGSLLGGLVVLGGLLVARPLVRWLLHAGSHRDPRVDPRAVEVGHETREARSSVVLISGLILIVGVALAVVLATWMQATWVRRPLTLNPPPGLATPAAPPAPPVPRLEAVPGAQLQRLRAAEDQILNGTGWVDRQAGIAHIPIDRAIDLTAQQGLPARSPEEAAQYGNESDQLPSSASSGRDVERRSP